jgi:uncharacterized protein YdbL (DUF1318 family)
MKKLMLVTGGTLISATALIASGGLAFAANETATHMSNGNGNGSGYSQQLQVKADTLKITVSELQEGLKTKTLAEIAKDKGVSIDAIHATTSAKAHERWVANGLSADEIKEREADQAERQADCDGTENGGGMRGGGIHRNQNTN